MIKIEFIVQNENYVGLRCNGHSGYAESGHDIVCASISTLAQSLYIGLSQVVKTKITYNLNEKNAHLELRLSDNISSKEKELSQVLFKTTFLSMQDIASGYPKNIKMEVKNL